MVYFVWLGILVEQTIRRVRQMNIEYIFVTVITLVTIFGAMSAIFTGAFAPDQVRAAAYSSSVNSIRVRVHAKFVLSGVVMIIGLESVPRLARLQGSLHSGYTHLGKSCGQVEYLELLSGKL